MSPNDPRSDSNDFEPRPDTDWRDLPLSGQPPMIPEVIPAEGDWDHRYVSYQRPPGPGFWGSVLWCISFVVVMLVTLIPVVVIDLAVQAQDHPDPQAWLEQQGDAFTRDQKLTPALARSFARGFLVAELFSVLYALLIVRWMIGRNWPRIVAFRLPRADHFVLCLLVVPGLMILHGGAHELAQLLVDPKGNAQVVDLGQMLKDMFDPWPRWLTVLVIGVGPALGEELWCRGFLGRGLLARYGFVAGVLLTSIFFGLLHGDIAYAIGTAAMGACLHFVYLMTRSLWAPILIHFLNNSVTMLIALGDINIPNIDADHPPRILYLGSACLVAAVFYALYVGRGQLRGVDGGPPPWEPPFPSVALPPPGSGTIVVHETPTPAAIALVVVGAAIFGACWYMA